VSALDALKQSEEEIKELTEARKEIYQEARERLLMSKILSEVIRCAKSQDQEGAR